MRFFLISFVFSGASQMLIAQGEGVTWSKKQSSHMTTFANRLHEGNANEDMTSQRSHKSPRPDKTDFTFKCPGDSFLTGIHVRAFTGVVKDQAFAFVCAFPEDGDGQFVQKSDCSADDAEMDNAGNKEGTSSLCSGSSKWAEGMKNQYYPAVKANDRVYRTGCCSAKTAKGTALKSSGCKELSISAGRSENLECPANTFIKSIHSKYDSSAQSRSYYIQCCSMSN